MQWVENHGMEGTFLRSQVHWVVLTLIQASYLSHLRHCKSNGMEWNKMKGLRLLFIIIVVVLLLFLLRKGVEKNFSGSNCCCMYVYMYVYM